MSVITLYINEDLKEKLKEVENKSELVTRLLYEYFEREIDSIEKLEIRLKEIEQEHRNHTDKIKEIIFLKKQKKKEDLKQFLHKEYIKDLQIESQKDTPIYKEIEKNYKEKLKEVENEN